MEPEKNEPHDSSAGSAWEKVARAIFGEPAKRRGKRQLLVGCAVLVLQLLLSASFRRLDLGGYLNLTLGMMFLLAGGGSLLYASRRTLANVLRLLSLLAFAVMLSLIVAVIIDWST